MVDLLSAQIDERNDAFTDAVQARILDALPDIGTESLEWLVMEHYQFSRANQDLLRAAADCATRFVLPAVVAELRRNAEEEEGHAAMYKQGMLDIGTDVDRREEFAPTTAFLAELADLCGPDPSRALGALYATEAAAVFEHETLYEVCREICERRGFAYKGSLVKRFHDIHLEGGVEQGHKDGLAAFVDFVDFGVTGGGVDGGEHVDRDRVLQGGLDAVEVMESWWGALLGRVVPEPAGTRANGRRA